MNKSAIVTGASSGIGLETSKHLVNDGWKVFGIDINYENKTALGGLSNNNLFKPLVCDLVSEDEVYKSMNIIQKEAQSIDALIACAGILRLGELSQMSVKDFDLIFNVNVRGLWLSVTQSMPMLKNASKNSGTARIVLLSSVSALRPKINSGAYSASKAAVSQLTRVLAVECAKDNILVNAIAPGTVDTPMVREQSSPDKQGNWRPSGPSPLGRISNPDDIVKVIKFLLDDNSSYVTGTTIPVDGGTQAAFIPPI